ncbi:MAG: phosphoribosylformylglycinamidine synthase subunit PurL, partial [Bacteroidetes bacterium]|nr:phosphoribosylformylglycinamidine synthase subunit PurL [Bacteroidota bacterium]
MQPSLPSDGAPIPTVETAVKLGLLPDEFNLIVEKLGRQPNFTELCAFSGMWSEHCSYKNSIRWLKTLPREGKGLLAEPGKENAGLVDIGQGLACAFKIESHNHPSAIEPYQGAATGVGGINRDIFTMGARPIAQLNALFFGEPTEARAQWLVKGVVKGIGDYGNAFGVPTVAGQTFFHSSFHQNPLVNAMSAGIVAHDKVMSAVAYGAGNPVFIVGSATGKDGIHGASFASAEMSGESSKQLPSVQVGDPFQEKLLLEATLELIEAGYAIGIQDMGAAGIICSTAEMSEKGNSGMRIHLERVPTRGEEMQPFELLLSESQERMLVVGKKGHEADIQRIFEKWDLNCSRIGEVIEEDRLDFYFHETLVAQLPASVLVLGGGAPVYEREIKAPSYLAEIESFHPSKVPVPPRLKEVAECLSTSPNLVPKHWIIRQYDSMIGTANLSSRKPSDAAIVWVKETNSALALTVDVNPLYVEANPEKGSMMAVAEAARNIVCSGARPIAITNCLNFGNPYNPEAYWQFVGAIKGMGKACKAFGTPVTGGNVSFYNQYREGEQVFPVAPSPSIGMLGILDRLDLHTGLAFPNAKAKIILVGVVNSDVSCSEYLRQWHKIEKSPAPYFNLDQEIQLHKGIAGLIENRLILSAHDVSEGGLYQCLKESALAGKIGFEVYSDDDIRTDAFWFGEGQGRVVVSVPEEHEDAVVDLLAELEVPALYLGEVGGNSLVFDGEVWHTMDELYEWNERHLKP